MWLRAGGDLELDRAADGRHLDRRPERRQRGGDVDRGHEVVAVAHEPLVLANADLHVQVARRSAPVADVATSGHPDPLPVGNSGRDIDRNLGPLDAAPAPSAHVARVASDPPVAVAHVARRGAHDLAERCPGDSAQLAGAAAARAGLDRVPGSAPLPLQFSQRLISS